MTATIAEVPVTGARKVTPSAVLLARADASREEWLALRQHGIGGSDALAVLGLDPWKTRMEVFLDKTGGIPDREQSDRMRWGQIVEEPIAQWFTERTGIGVRRCGLLRHCERGWQRVSVDRLTDDGGLLEAKNTNYHRRGEWEDDLGEIIADGAEAQAQHGMAVTGLSHAWVCAQVGGEPPVIRRVERDVEFIASLTEVEADFWKLVLDGTPPALDGGEKAAKLIARLYPDVVPGKSVELTAAQVGLLREYRKELASAKAAEERKKEIQALITSVMGDAETAVFEGRKVASWGHCNRTQVSKDNIALLRERYPDAAAEVVETKGYRRFSVTKEAA